MNLIHIALTGAAMASLIIGVSEPRHAQGDTSGPTRTIAYLPGVALKTHLIPGDKTVVVTRTVNGIRPTSDPTIAQELIYAKGMSDSVVIAELVDDDSVLIEDDSWIGSRLRFRTVQAILPANSKADAEVNIVWNGGGELRIGDVTVRAGLPWRPSASKRYLLFLGRNGDTGGYFMSRTPLVIENDLVVNPWQRDGAVKVKDVLHRRPLRSVLDSLR